MRRNTIILLVIIGIVAIIAYNMMNSETIEDVIEEVCIAKHESAEERQLCKKDMQELVKLMKNYGIKDSSDIKKMLRCHIKPKYIQCILDIGISPLKLYPFVAAVVARNTVSEIGIRFKPLLTKLDEISKNPVNYLVSLF